MAHRTAVLAQLPYQVVKKDYSAGKWRVLDADGRQVLEWKAYPGVEKLPPFLHPVCFDRKRDALTWIAEHP